MSSSKPLGTVIDVSHAADARVATISFSRGEYNYLTYDFLDELSTAVERAALQGSRAIVLRSGGRRFCAGADFAQPSSGAVGPSIYDLVPRLFSWPIPVVAAIGGAAVGGGFGLSLVADYRVVSESAYFLANFTRLGITPGFGMTHSLPALVGAQRASDIFATSRRVDAKEAFRIGLADRLVDRQRLDAEAMEMAIEVATAAPDAVAIVRRRLRGLEEGELLGLVERERQDQQALMAREDFREGVRAWQERRAPDFTGR